MTLLSVNGSASAFSGDCPWRGKHKQPDSLCTLTVSEDPHLRCPDPACKDRTFQDLVMHWKDGWVFAQPAQEEDPDEKPHEDDGFESLGFSIDGRYFYQSARNGHIVALSASAHNEVNLYQIVPSGTFWKTYCGGNGISWKKIARMMMASCHAKGYYTHTETRGAGIFMDRDRVVVNLGACLLVNNPGETSFTPVHMANFKGEFSYASPKRMTLPPPLERKDLDKILPLLEAMPLSDKSEALILAGAIVCGHMAGALPWRPHFWLNGAAGGGKSDILMLIMAALQPVPYYFKGDTSAAGIRDSLRNASGLVIVDEVEKMGGSSDRMSNGNAIRRVDALTEMMRSASDGSVAKVAKGGPGGQGYEVQIRCCAFFASIYYGIEMAQDYRRFCFVTLSNPESRDPEQKKEYKARIRPMLKETFTHEFAMRLYSWSVVNSRWILEIIEFFRQNMLDFTKDAGESDQWGTVLGAAWCMTRFGEAPTAEDVQTMFTNAYNNMESVAWEMLDANHGEQAMQALLQSKPQGEHFTVGEQVESVRRAIAAGHGDDNGSFMWLARHGIRVDAENLLLCPGHRQLRKLMAEEGYRDYKQAFMSRKDVAMRVVPEKLDFAGFQAGRVIVVPLPKPKGVVSSKRQVTVADVQQYGRKD